MKRILRYVFVAALMMSNGSVFAQDSNVAKFDFCDKATLSLFGLEGYSSSKSHAGDMTQNNKATINGVSITVYPKDPGSNAGAENRFYNYTFKKADGESYKRACMTMYSNHFTISADQPMDSVLVTVSSVDGQFHMPGIVDQDSVEIGSIAKTGEGLNEITYTWTPAEGKAPLELYVWNQYKAKGTKGSVQCRYFSITVYKHDNSTALQTVNAGTQKGNKEIIHNLAGQRVTPAYRGIIIKDGRKYLQK